MIQEGAKTLIIFTLQIDFFTLKNASCAGVKLHNALPEKIKNIGEIAKKS